MVDPIFYMGFIQAINISLTQVFGNKTVCCMNYIPLNFRAFVQSVAVVQINIPYFKGALTKGGNKTLHPN